MNIILAKILAELLPKAFGKIKKIKTSTAIIIVILLLCFATACPFLISLLEKAPDPYKETVLSSDYNDFVIEKVKSCGLKTIGITLAVSPSINPISNTYVAKFSSAWLWSNDYAHKLLDLVSRSSVDNPIQQLVYDYWTQKLYPSEGEHKALGALNKAAPYFISLRARDEFGNSYQNLDALDPFSELKRFVKGTIWYRNKELDRMSVASVLVHDKLVYAIIVAKGLTDDPTYCDTQALAMDIKEKLLGRL